MVSVMRKPDRPDNKPASLPKNRVVPIDQANPPNPEKPSFVLSDPVSHRVIFAIGGRRIALDFAARISDLAPETGDAPAPVLPWSKDDQNALPAAGGKKRPSRSQRPPPAVTAGRS
jgi:hypothetical protein